MLEEQLVDKQYFKQFIKEVGNPVTILANLFSNGQDIDSIRFAQGEVYFRHGDFETAIFKWDQVQGELTEWAWKNKADAYTRLGLHEDAIFLYESIATESDILQLEISLSLLELYQLTDQNEKVHQVIERAIELDPDYKQVAKKAIEFYKQTEDDDHAILLTIAEVKRTCSPFWVEHIRKYAQLGLMDEFSPNLFIELFTLFANEQEIDLQSFILLICERYEQSERQLEWLAKLNDFIISQQGFKQFSDLSTYYQNKYIDFIEGKYSLEVAKKYVPDLLTAWFLLKETPDRMFAGASLLAWSDYYPAQIDHKYYEAAQQFFIDSERIPNIEEKVDGLHKRYEAWMLDQKYPMNEHILRLIKYVQENDATEYIFVANSNQEGQEQVENTAKAETKYLFQQGNTLYKETGKLKAELAIADQLIYFVSKEETFTEELLRLKEDRPGLPISFIFNGREEENWKEEIEFITTYLTPSKYYFLEDDVCSIMNTIGKGKHSEQLAKKLILIRNILESTSNERQKLLQSLQSSIEKLELLIPNLNAGIQQLIELQEKTKISIQSAYQIFISEIKEEVKRNIPDIVKQCIESLIEANEYEQFYEQLMDRLNAKIKEYLTSEVLPVFSSSLHDWEQYSKQEIDTVQAFVREWKENINQMVGENKLIDFGQYEQLTEWENTIQKISAPEMWGSGKIILQRNISRALRKGSTKILGFIPKRNFIFKNVYSSFLEDENISEISDAILNQLFEDSYIFEKQVKRDLGLFLQSAIEEAEQFEEGLIEKLQQKQVRVMELYEKENDFQMMIGLYDIRLRTYEWIYYAAQHLV